MKATMELLPLQPGDVPDTHADVGNSSAPSAGVPAPRWTWAWVALSTGIAAITANERPQVTPPPPGPDEDHHPLRARSMLALVQRVSDARVDVAGRRVGEIAPGLLVLVCAEPADVEAQADKLVDKLLKLRIFGDEAGKMNRSVQDIGGGLLIVSQFTLAAKGEGGRKRVREEGKGKSKEGRSPKGGETRRTAKREKKNRNHDTSGGNRPTSPARHRPNWTAALREGGGAGRGPAPRRGDGRVRRDDENHLIDEGPVPIPIRIVS